MAEIVWESDAQSYGFTVMSNGMVWPDDWSGTLVEAQFTSARGDGSGLDRDPDMEPSGPGYVSFTPQVKTVGYDGEHGKRIVSLHPFEAVVGDDGYLYTPDEYGQPGIRGIVLPSNNSDVVDEHDWTWRVTFDIPDTTIRATHIPTPHDHSVDIKDYLDSDANHGVRVVVDRVAAREAVQAASEAVAARTGAETARDQAGTHASTAADILTDTQAAARMLRFPTSAGESLAASLDMQTGSTNLVILGDSTTNDPWDWPRRALDSLMLKYSGLHVEESVWSSNAYPTPTVLQAGDHFEPGGVSVVIDDEFNRTGTLPGSTPAVGGTWEGAEWTLDGTNALAPSSTGRVLSEGVAGEATTLARGVRIDTSESAGGRQFDLYSHYVDANNHLMLSVSIGGSGSQVARIYARVDGSPNQIAVTSDLGLPASTVNHIDISMTLDGRQVSATIGPTTIEGTLTVAQAATLVQGAQYGFGRGIPANSNEIAVNSFTVTLLNPTTPSGWGLQVWNGGSAGSDLSWQRDRLPDILGPTAPNIVVIASSHNYGTTTPEAYIADVNATVDAVTALYPDVEIIASGQNPQYEGTSTTPSGIAAHAARIAALRIEASRKGWGYLPVYETFASQPDGGRDWVEPDGVHPKGSLPSQYPGYQVWADVFTAYLDSLSHTDNAATRIRIDNSVGERIFVGGKMVYGDTGWREISDHLTVESENPSIYIKRENSTVWLSFNRFNPIATIGAYATILNIPQGFVPERSVRIGEGATYELGAKLYTSGSNLNISSAVEPGSKRFYASWSASDVWPSLLPGSPT